MKKLRVDQKMSSTRKVTHGPTEDTAVKQSLEGKCDLKRGKKKIPGNQMTHCDPVEQDAFGLASILGAGT